VAEAVKRVFQHGQDGLGHLWEQVCVYEKVLEFQLSFVIDSDVELVVV
jgi:hypothetical protein